MARKSQPAEPRGLAGVILGWLMLALNRRDNERSVRLLDAREGDRILEIGCGPGQLVELLAQRAHQGYVAGSIFLNG
jgi:ubiquinone/menaquinone biosynthesis C-methylase UbiE